ncbi:trypsin-like peptidase domain-containing protein [Pseudidiomarina taiwanensis]|uniref:Serine protease n=1 Tax=Pseudidiomarina taiwanensis TaxID=337250 RepID=A0A432ZKK3_9GAMM|nr:trypsin-like peptidase domain-containing protein [Pseudidiomarina taiwanensis]RUO78557.1 serine protease [Pseudidiomarina taiwanensis]
MSKWVWLIVRSSLVGLGAALLVLWATPLWQDYQVEQSFEQAPLSFAKAVNRAAPAVVNIYSLEQVPGRSYYEGPSLVARLGSGVIMDNKGHILTAYHVVANNDQIQVALQDGRQYSGYVIGGDAVTDLAVIRIEADNLPVIPQQQTMKVRAGDVVLAIGNPLNLGQTITQGIVSAAGGRMGVLNNSHADLIQMDAVINEGASGGALVNSNGYLVGINNARYRDNSGQGISGIYFAVPYSIAKWVMDTLIQEGEVVRGYFGIQVGPNEASQSYQQAGIYVNGVDPNSPAEQAGLRQGDYIIEMDGVPVTSVASGLELVARSKPGTVIEVSFFRATGAGDYEMLTRPVTIAKLNSR